jgi:multiple sugar transport system permease protein
VTTARRVAVGSVLRPPQAAARRRWKGALIGWSFALPWVVLFLVFMAGPIILSFLLSLTSFGIADIANPLGVSFIGLQNYAELLRDPRFLQASFNTAYFVVAGVPLTLITGMLAAIALNQGVLRFRALFRVGYYLPVVTSIVAIAVVWRYMLDPDVGILNAALAQAGIEGPDWLGDPNTTMPSIIALAVWRNIGNSMVIFLAALQTVDPQLYEAARVDGAKGRQLFRHVTVPMLRPAILFTTVITTIGYLQVFEEPFVMTGPSGGTQQSAFTTSMYVYQEGFGSFNLGYASAVAYALFTAIVVLAILQFKFLRSDA